MAILIAHVFFNVAVVVRVVGTFWAGLDPRVSEAAATLGASPVRSLREVTLPLLAPALASAASIVFLFSFTSFGDRPHPRRPAVLDPRDGDLQPGRADVRPASGGGPRARAARLRRPRSLGGHAPGAEAGARRAAAHPSATCCAGSAHGARRHSPRSASARWRSSSAFRSPSWSSARSQSETATAWRPIVRSAGRRTRCSRRPGRQCVNSVVYAAGASPHRARRRRVGGVCRRRLAAEDGPGCSTDPSCSPSARPR